MAKGGARILWSQPGESGGTEFLSLQISSRVGSENQEGLPPTRYFAGSSVGVGAQRAEDAIGGGCDQTLEEKRGDTEAGSGVGRAQERMPWCGQSSRGSGDRP